MRVTQKMMTDSMSQSLLLQRNSLYRQEKIVATGKRIQIPSDDPLGKGQSLEIRATLATVAQYLNNLTRAATRLEVTEKLLSGMEDQLKIARETALNGLQSPAQNQISADYVKTLREQLLSYANQRYEGQYLFAGRIADTQPFLADGTYHGDDGDVSVITGYLTQVKINVTGAELFQLTGGTADVITALIDLENAFIAGDSAQVANQVDIIEAARAKIQSQRISMGMQQFHLAMSESYWTDFKPKMESILIGLENADMTQAIVELRSLETAYQTALNVVARVIQPTILNYL